ncbi:MAG: hypothetical protein DHS20C21_00950 [Gemmatimonadota bacterium]|nr:MAG: hypothetical protein DHS20C21_00950 [Gemmatimonadota bacterium]
MKGVAATFNSGARRRIGRISVFVLALALLSTAGCTGLGVKPWERDDLARPMMQLDVDPLNDAIDDHIRFSREASSGGRGFGGGGCGCN